MVVGSKPLALSHCSNVMSFSLIACGGAPRDAATLALVLSSAPNATNETSPRVARRATYTGPSNVRPLTDAARPLDTNSIAPGRAIAPSDACQGKPLRLLSTISRATGPAPEITPETMSRASWTPTDSVWPTIRERLWSLRMGRLLALTFRPARSTTTGCAQPGRTIAPPV